MRGKAISRLIREEFERQGLLVTEPSHVQRFTEPAGEAWHQGSYPSKLAKLLSGEMLDAELSEVDLNLIAACLYEFSGNSAETRNNRYDPFFVRLQIALNA